jgi:hypothetical protein
MQGVYFDEHSWDGSDVFSPKGMNMRLLTRRAYEALRVERVENSTFTPLTEVKISEDVVKTFSNR